MKKIELAKKAAELAAESMKNSTFGVGGLLIDNKTMKIVHTQHNKVIVDGRVNDPTAHVERQTVDWYFKRKAENKFLPDPKDMTIISSLDPCMMCAGSILSAGFNVVSLGLDDFAGVDFDGSYGFKSLPRELAMQAAKSFSYFGVEGKKEYKGFMPDVFNGVVIPTSISTLADTSFANSLLTTKSIVSNGDTSAISCDVEELRADSSKYKVLNMGEIQKPLYEILLKTAGGILHKARQYDSAILTLPNGENLMVRESHTLQSPILTPVIRLIRDYVSLQNMVHSEGKGKLPHLKYCQITMLHGFGNAAVDVATLGAYGSAMEGPIPTDNINALTFLSPRQSQRSLDEMISCFPPLYTDVIGIKPKTLTL